MKTIILSAIFSMTLSAPLLAYDTNVLHSEKLQVSYAIGMMFGEQWKAGGIDVNDKMLLRGLDDAQNGKTIMTVQEMRSTLAHFQQELAKKREKQRSEIAAKNLKISDAFLAKNKQKKGIVTLPDGLQYQVITEGSGPSPSDHDTVTVSYEGTLMNGTVFNHSDKASFQLNGIIPGWREALKHMKVGSHWKVFIPPNLAYGAYGRPPRIQPNDALIFDLHLISIQHPKPITSDIIKVPSAEEMKKGAKVEIIKPDEAQKMEEQQQSHSAK